MQTVSDLASAQASRRAVLSVETGSRGRPQCQAQRGCRTLGGAAIEALGTSRERSEIVGIRGSREPSRIHCVLRPVAAVHAWYGTGRCASTVTVSERAKLCLDEGIRR